MQNKLFSLALAISMCITANAQQSNVNLSHNPQKDTEGLVPFSASLNSPQVNDDQTVVFRIKAPQAIQFHYLLTCSSLFFKQVHLWKHGISYT